MEFRSGRICRKIGIECSLRGIQARSAYCNSLIDSCQARSAFLLSLLQSVFRHRQRLLRNIYALLHRYPISRRHLKLCLCLLQHALSLLNSGFCFRNSRVLAGAVRATPIVIVRLSKARR